MAVTQATQIWAYTHGLVPFAHLAVGDTFTHPRHPETVYIKTSKTGWYRERDGKAKYRGNAGTAVKLVTAAPATCWCGCGSTQPHQTAATEDGQ